MKKLIISLTVIVSFSASALAQGTMLTIDNLNGAGGQTATSNGLFFGGGPGQPYTGGTINVVVLGGPNANSIQPLAALTGANALFYSGVPGVFLDPTFSTYNVPGVAPGQPAVLQVIAWRGSAPTYEAAAAIDRFCAWNGTTYVPANAFTFINPTGGGGTPPGPPKSLDGMPAMAIYLECVPEPSTAALAVLGMVTLLILRRRYY